MKSHRYLPGILIGFAAYSSLNLFTNVPFSYVIAALSIVGGVALALRLFRDTFRINSEKYANMGIVLVIYWAVTVFCITIGFASIYVDMIRQNPNQFSGLVDGLTAIYFSFNTFSTVGIGDIHPISPLAKVLVMSEIVVAIILLPIVISTFVARIVTNIIKKQCEVPGAEFKTKKQFQLMRIK